MPAQVLISLSQSIRERVRNYHLPLHRCPHTKKQEVVEAMDVSGAVEAVKVQVRVNTVLELWAKLDDKRKELKRVKKKLKARTY